MATYGINDQSSVVFSGLVLSNLSPADQAALDRLVNLENARRTQQNEQIAAENARRAKLDPPQQALATLPPITSHAELLQTVTLPRAHREGQNSWVNQAFTEETEANNAQADGLRRLDANEVLAGRSAANPSMSTRRA